MGPRNIPRDPAPGDKVFLGLIMDTLRYDKAITTNSALVFLSCNIFTFFFREWLPVDFGLRGFGRGARLSGDGGAAHDSRGAGGDGVTE